MTAMAQFFRDPRRRSLVILAALALFSVVAVVWAVGGSKQEASTDYAPEDLLPGFAQKKHLVTNIRIASGGETFELQFIPDNGWVLPQRHSYPAAFEQVQRLLLALETFRTVAPKTSQKEWLARLDLNSPETGGKGVAIRASDEAGNRLADIIVGKRANLDGGSGMIGLYVRKANDTQSWLVRSDFVPSGDPAVWLDKAAPAIAVDRIMRVTVEPISGPSFTVARGQPDGVFTLLGVPSGRSLADPSAPNDIGTMLSDFDFDDARPLQDVDFDNAPRAVIRTFDGLMVTVETTRMGSYYWARVTAEGDAPKSRQEARAIASRTGSWAYRLPQERGQRFFTTLERLLAPVPIRK